MRRTIGTALAVVAALAVTSVAVAKLKSADLTAASATFTAPTATHVQTRTYSCNGQTIEITTGRYTGTAASTIADLNGPVELKLHSVYNTTTKLGTVEATLKIRAADGRSTARLSAVNVDGRLDGWLRGSAGRGDGSLLGSLTATFNRTTGFADGAIGTGTGANAAVISKRGTCRRESTSPSVRLHVRGTIESLSSSALAVKPHDGGATQSCSITSASPRTSSAAVGQRVEMQCAQISGAYVLTKLKRRR
jgi:hypothetical protein